VKFGFIVKHRGIWPADWLCEALGVSRGGFYAWLTRPRSHHSRQDGASRRRPSRAEGYGYEQHPRRPHRLTTLLFGPAATPMALALGNAPVGRWQAATGANSTPGLGGRGEPPTHQAAPQTHPESSCGAGRSPPARVGWWRRLRKSAARYFRPRHSSGKHRHDAA
jgi:hypothetical protein